MKFWVTKSFSLWSVIIAMAFPGGVESWPGREGGGTGFTWGVLFDGFVIRLGMVFCSEMGPLLCEILIGGVDVSC